MSSAALFDLLPDFGARAPRAAAGAAAAEPRRTFEAPAPRADIATIVAEAVAQAEAALEARLAGEHQAALEAERQANADEAKTFLESLGTDMGETIAARVDLMETRVGDLVGAAVARIVGGLLSDDLRKRSIDMLARSIRETVGDAEAVRLNVRGPLSLFETLKAALGPCAANLDFVEAPGFDLAVVIDDTVFETRMAEWSAALSEVLS